MLLAGRSFPDGPPPPNQQALAFSGFTTPMGISRHPSIHTYEDRLAVLRARMRIASGLVNGYEVGWTSGTIEPGSSGSGLFTSNGHYLVGVLSCGPLPPTCNSPWAGYSKFANFYPQIRQYIYSGVPSAPVANPATFVASHSFRANWSSVSGATGYRLDVATNNSFTNYVTGYQNLNVGNALSRSVAGLSPSTTYYCRVRAYNGNGTSGNSNVVSVTTLRSNWASGRHHQSRQP